MHSINRQLTHVTTRPTTGLQPQLTLTPKISQPVKTPRGPPAPPPPRPPQLSPVFSPPPDPAPHLSTPLPPTTHTATQPRRMQRLKNKAIHVATQLQTKTNTRQSIVHRKLFETHNIIFNFCKDFMVLTISINFQIYFIL